MHRVFEETARRFPQAIALECGSTRLTYAQVEGRANQMASALRKRGVGRGDCVGLLLPRCTDLIVAILGILKAGAAYVPLDRHYPPDRIEYILSNSQARALISTAALAKPVGTFDGVRVLLDRDEPLIEGESGLPLKPEEVGSRGEDLCYIIYTSGTTGRPKGVQIEHHSVCHLVKVQDELFEVCASDRVFLSFSIAFDASVTSIWLAWSVGATLVVGTEQMAQAGTELPQFLSQARITVLFCVPTLALLMQGEIPSMRLLMMGGEVCPDEIIRRWAKPGRRIFNVYGPTEVTVIATCVECFPDKHVTIGRALPGYSTFVLTEERHPVAEGEAGELYLGGAGLARGYAGRPELTQERFVTCAPGKEPSQRLYRTGDLVRWTAGGELEFLGRIDTQIKVRGFRIELGEIEAVLLDYPGVLAVAVTLREVSKGIQQLVAFVVEAPGASLDLGLLRDHARKHLAHYMVPDRFVGRAALPTLTSGKIDRRALQSLPIASESQERYVAPRTPLEERLVSLWEKVLRRSHIGVQDRFQDLGGHSLLATELVATLNQECGYDLKASDLLENQTIEELARFVADVGGCPAKRLAQLSGGAATPIVFLNPPMEVRRLAELLGTPHPVLVSEFPFDKETLEAVRRCEYSKLPSIPEMARPHVELIRSQLGKGPCILAGYSYGGLLAYEAAQQLMADGGKVERLMLFDTDRTMSLAERVRRGFWRHLKGACHAGPRYILEKCCFLHQNRQNEKALLELATRRQNQAEMGELLNDATWATINRLWLVGLKNYRWKKVVCPATLIKATHSYSPTQDYDGVLGWKGYFVPELKVSTVVATHVSMWREPAVEQLAAICRGALASPLTPVSRC